MTVGIHMHGIIITTLKTGPSLGEGEGPPGQPANAANEMHQTSLRVLPSSLSGGVQASFGP